MSSLVALISGNEMFEIGDPVEVSYSNRKIPGVVTALSEVYCGHINKLGYEPGVYQDLACPTIKLAGDGRKTQSMDFEMPTLQLADPVEYERRSTKVSIRRRMRFLRPLPETPFWEGDRVEIVDTKGTLYLLDSYVVESIDFHKMIYHLCESLTHRAHRAHVEASQIKLLERGNVWRLYHGEAPVFTDLKEESEFLQLFKTSTVDPGPLGPWTLRTALQAIHEGLAHGMNLASNLNGPVITLHRFADPTIGTYVAQATLTAFKAL